VERPKSGARGYVARAPHCHKLKTAAFFNQSCIRGQPPLREWGAQHWATKKVYYLLLIKEKIGSECFIQKFPFTKDWLNKRTLLRFCKHDTIRKFFTIMFFLLHIDIIKNNIDNVFVKLTRFYFYLMCTVEYLQDFNFRFQLLKNVCLFLTTIFNKFKFNHFYLIKL